MSTKLYDLFVAQGHEWKFGGELRVPDYEDFKAVLDKLIESVGTLEVERDTDSAQIEIGHLLARKIGNKVDVFLHIDVTET